MAKIKKGLQWLWDEHRAEVIFITPIILVVLGILCSGVVTAIALYQK